MNQWLDKLPLPHWASLTLATVLLVAALVFLWRYFRLKTVTLGPLEFERNSPAATPEPKPGISQEVSAGRGGSVSGVEQKAEGAGIRQKVKSEGKITGVKQDAKNC